MKKLAITRQLRCCVVCKRRNTLLVQWASGSFPDTSYRWSCWRPSHIRQALRQAKASSEGKAAYRQRWNIPA